jgi:hypothetical protein
MKEIKYTILYCAFVRTFVIPFYYGSGTVISYGSGSGSTRQKDTVPTVPVPVPQHCLPPREKNNKRDARWVGTPTVLAGPRIEQICLKISACTAESETYRIISLSTHLFSHWSIPLTPKTGRNWLTNDWKIDKWYDTCWIPSVHLTKIYWFLSRTIKSISISRNTNQNSFIEKCLTF